MLIGNYATTDAISLPLRLFFLLYHPVYLWTTDSRPSKIN